MKLSRKTIHADSKCAKAHGKDLVQPGEMHLERDHKKWYLRQDLGKQLGKPHALQPNVKKSPKTWKTK
ncbi:MAG: hypothetical protein ACD_58C00295G0002 [uncultured bacterium]|nr:MAG: hypothetical protein ACD_58C00295G0002 [uncultured bacterium]